MQELLSPILYSLLWNCKYYGTEMQKINLIVLNSLKEGELECNQK